MIIYRKEQTNTAAVCRKGSLYSNKYFFVLNGSRNLNK